MKVKPLEVQLGQVTRLQAVPANIEFFPEVVQVIVSKLLRRFGNDEVGEGLTHRENGLLLLRMVLSISLRCSGTRTVEAPTALFTSLKQPGHTDAVVVGVIGFLAQRDVRTGDDQIWVLPYASLDLLCFDGEQVLLRRKQNRILYTSQVNCLLHGDGHVGLRRLTLTIPNPGKQQDECPSQDDSTTFFVMERPFASMEAAKYRPVRANCISSQTPSQVWEGHRLVSRPRRIRWEEERH